MVIKGRSRQSISEKVGRSIHYHVVIVSKDSEVVATHKPENRPSWPPTVVWRPYPENP